MLLLGVTSFETLAVTSESLCTYLRKELPAMQDQLPMRTDKTTTLTAINAIYTGRACLLSYSYLIDTEKYVQEMTRENGYSVEDNARWLKSEEASLALKKTFTQIARGSAKAALEPIIKHKGVKVSYIYSFDDLEIIPIIAVGADTTK